MKQSVTNWSGTRYRAEEKKKTPLTAIFTVWSAFTYMPLRQEIEAKS